MTFFDFALQALAWLICVPLVFLLAIFIAEVVAGMTKQRANRHDSTLPDTVIVMPAHNEAGGLGACLAALRPVVPGGVRILVVADNCSDATADIARNAGVDVIERTDAVNRGKGFALAFARDHLSQTPPECVIVLDADCIPVGETVDILRAATSRFRVPVQATNLLRADLMAPPMVQISNFAFLVKNLIRQRGAGRIGGVAVLGGTGMALPWDLFAEAPLASSDLVEDLSLGIFAVRKDRAPQFVEAARVVSAAAESANALTQRTRWEHGFVDTAAKRALPLLIEGLRMLSMPRFWMGCHLCVPPLAMLCGLAGLGLVILAPLAIFADVQLPAVLLAVLLGMVLSLIVITWFREGRPYLAGGALLRIPVYILWKVPIYLKLFGRRENEWKRTKRPGE